MRRLTPDPARARVRVYSTQSTHKTLTSLRQGSMIHVWDQDFGQKVEATFHEAYMTHTSDLARTTRSWPRWTWAVGEASAGGVRAGAEADRERRCGSATRWTTTRC